MSGGAETKKPPTNASAGLGGFFIVAAIVALLITLAAVNIAIHPGGPGNSRASGIVGSVLFFGFFCLFAHLAIQAEHHWHWHRRGLASADPAAQLAEAQSLNAPTISTPAVATMPTLHQTFAIGRGRQRHGPISAVIVSVVLVLFTAFSISFMVSSIRGANRSHETQKHGIATTVTVVSIHHEQHSSRYSTWYTADITAALPDGSTTVVHDINDSDDDAGTPLSVLIDPKDGNYAEFPGQPKGSTSDWLIAIVFIFLSLLADVAVIRGAVRMVRRHRQLQ